MEDFSDLELARYLEENLAAKWLCRFTLLESSHQMLADPGTVADESLSEGPARDRMDNAQSRPNTADPKKPQALETRWPAHPH